jgi:hypothetical protein
VKTVEITYRYEGGVGLAYPPLDLPAFNGFADAVIRSERIAKLLEPLAE